MNNLKLLLVLIILPLFTYSQTELSENVELRGRLAYGPNSVVKIDGDNVYLASGGVLITATLNNNGQLIEKGHLQFNGAITDIESIGSTVYVALGYGGVKIVDVSNIGNPTLVGPVVIAKPDPNAELEFTKLNISGGYLFLISYDWAFMADYSNPTSLHIVHSFSGADGASIFYMAKEGDYIYQGQGGTSTGLVVYKYYSNGDVNISSVHSYYQDSPDATEHVKEIILKNDLIYILDSSYGMFIMSIGSDGTGYPHSNVNSYVINKMIVQKDYAFLLNAFNKFEVVDIKDSYNSKIIKEIKLPDPTDLLTDFEISEASIIVISSKRKGFYSYDAKDANIPFEVDFIEGGSESYDIEVDGDIMYVAAGYQGLKIFKNIKEDGKVTPKLLGRYSVHGNNSFDMVQVYGSYAYLLDRNEFVSVDISDPTQIVRGSSYKVASGFVEDYVIKDGYLFSADDKGVTVLDVSDPTNISLATTYVMSEYPSDIEIQGHYVYLANGTKGLVVLDVSDLTNIHEIGSYIGSNEYYEEIIIQGNYAYVSDSNHGIKVFDISTPSNPINVGNYPLYGDDSWMFNNGFSISGSYLYVILYGDRGSEVKEINISNPNNISEKGFYVFGGFPTSIDSEDYLFYVLDNDDGLYILENTNEDATPPCHVRGSQDGIWDCDTIYVYGNCTVPEGKTLTIESGTKVMFLGNYSIDVDGKLLASGTVSDTIKFMSQDKTEGWGGITFYDSELGDYSKLEYCVFTDGNANGDIGYKKYGGAVSIVNTSNISINNTVFIHNKADLMGGAIYLENSLPEISNCKFYNNSVLEGVGGAIAILNASPSFSYLDFVANGAKSGGALAVQAGSPIFSNSLFDGNDAAGFGEVIHFTNAHPSFVNVTMVNNGSGTDKVVYGMNGSTLNIINSILWDGDQEQEIFLEEGNPNVTYSNIRNASGKVWFGAGCLDMDPIFAVGKGYQLSSTEYGETNNSPAIDAGHPDSLDVSLSALTGKGGTRADMGAYGGGSSANGLGIENNSAKTFVVYPNPAHNFLTIRSSKGVVIGFNYSIYSLDGRELVSKQKFISSKEVVDISNFKKGIYFVKIDGVNKSLLYRVIKN